MEVCRLLLGSPMATTQLVLGPVGHQFHHHRGAFRAVLVVQMIVLKVVFVQEPPGSYDVIRSSINNRLVLIVQPVPTRWDTPSMCPV